MWFLTPKQPRTLGMIGFVLMALALGALIGFFFLRWWSAIVVIVLPLPFYAAIALDIYGNGFGDNWQYAIPLWVVPAGRRTSHRRGGKTCDERTRRRPVAEPSLEVLAISVQIPQLSQAPDLMLGSARG